MYGSLELCYPTIGRRRGMGTPDGNMEQIATKDFALLSSVDEM